MQNLLLIICIYLKNICVGFFFNQTEYFQLQDEDDMDLSLPELPAKKPSRKRKLTPENELLAKACEALQTVSSQKKSDAEEAFGHYVALKLRLIKSQSKRNECEQQIVGILTNYLAE